MDSLGESWSLTEEFATKLFLLTTTFMGIQLIFGLLGGTIIADGSLWFIVVTTLIKYATLMPLFYLFFSLYKSLKQSLTNRIVNQDENFSHGVTRKWQNLPYSEISFFNFPFT